MAWHAQIKFVMTECSKTQIRLTRPKCKCFHTHNVETMSYQHHLSIMVLHLSCHVDKTSKITCAPSKDSDLPGHPPSLIRVFAVRMKKPWILSYPFSASEDSVCTCHFVGFVMWWLILITLTLHLTIKILKIWTPEKWAVI